MEKLLLSLFAVSIFAASGFADELLVKEDFESAWTSSVPPGWSISGGQTPADYYTQDTSNPHAGQACLKIRHPADAAWRCIEVSAERFPTKPGMIYTISFWARAEQPGNAKLDWRGLQSFKPYLDSPSKGNFKLDAGNDWKEFKFSLREGQDFFADEARYILLTFSAVWNSKDERTLWIDDLCVSEAPDPKPLGMINDRTIKHDELQHRLKPGDRLEFTIDPAKRLRPVTKEASGLSFHMVSGWTNPYHHETGKYQLGPLEDAIRDLHLPMTRIYAVADKPFGVDNGIDKVAEMLKRLEIPEEHCVLEFEHQHASDALPPETWAQGVKHSLESGYKFHYWEITNEPFSSTWGNPEFGKSFPTPDSYIKHFKEVAPAIRAADPQAKLGVGIDLGQTMWSNYVLKQLAGQYDFVAPHYYFWARLKQTPFEEVALTGNFQMLDKALRTKALINAYNPGREAYQYDTEWGVLGHVDGEEEGFEVRTANIVAAMHVAVRLIYYTREDILRGASGWCLLGWIKKPANGILTLNAPEKRYMLYWLYYYFNRHVGEWALDTDGTAPYYKPQQARDQAKSGGPLTPVLATLSKDEKQIYLVIANASWDKSVPCNVNLKDFPVDKTTGVLLTSDKLDAYPLLEKKEDAIKDLEITREEGVITCTIPAHSIAFVTLERAK